MGKPWHNENRGPKWAHWQKVYLAETLRFYGGNPSTLAYLWIKSGRVIAQLQRRIHVLRRKYASLHRENKALRKELEVRIGLTYRRPP